MVFAEAQRELEAAQTHLDELIDVIEEAAYPSTETVMDGPTGDLEPR